MRENTDQKNSEYEHFSRSDLFSKCQKIHSYLQVCSHLLKIPLNKGFYSLCRQSPYNFQKTLVKYRNRLNKTEELGGSDYSVLQNF